jgi:hypothetical protein
LSLSLLSLSALRVALAWGDVDDGDVAPALDLLDRVLAMLWRMTY